MWSRTERGRSSTTSSHTDRFGPLSREIFPEKSGGLLNEQKLCEAHRIGFSAVDFGSKQNPIKMRGPACAFTNESNTCGVPSEPSGARVKRKIHPSSLPAH